MDREIMIGLGHVISFAPAKVCYERDGGKRSLHRSFPYPPFSSTPARVDGYMCYLVKHAHINTLTQSRAY